MNKRRALLLSIIAIISLVVITVGVTVAFFNYSKQGSTENVIKSGGITFYYDEVDKNGNGINLVDALPTPDSEGKAQANGFNFKVEALATENISIPYEITLRKKAGSDNIDDIVKVYLAKTTATNAAVNTEEEVVTSMYSSLEDTTHNGYSEKVLYTTVVPATESSYTQNYRLKLWIDNDTDYSPVVNQVTGEDEYPYENKTFTVMVNIYANGRVITEEGKRANVSSVGVNNTVLTKEEINGIDTYEATLPEGTTSATINVETENPYSSVTIIKTQSDYTTPVAKSNTEKVAVNKTVSLTNGNNYFKIITTSEDNKVTKETHMLIKIQRSVVIFGDTFPVIEAEPTLTTSSNETSDASGLYALDVTNGFGGANGTTYYFRGNVNNNYVDFAGKVWRIVRINEDGTVRLILDDAIDTTNYKFNSNDNSYTDMYYSNSEIKQTLDAWYTNNITGTNANKVATGNYFCEAAVVSGATYNTEIGTTFMKEYTEYIPNYKCETDGNGHGVLDNTYKIGLITYDEALGGGAYYYPPNTDYYLYDNYKFWTMSPGGIYIQSYATDWYVEDNGRLGTLYVHYDGTYGNMLLRPVINLKADVTAHKDSSTGHYVVD